MSNVVPIAVLLTVTALIYINSSMILINPTISIRYTLYQINYLDIESEKKRSGMILTKSKYLEEDDLLDIEDVGPKLFTLNLIRYKMLKLEELLEYAEQLKDAKKAKITLYFVTRHLKIGMSKAAKVTDKYDFKVVKAPIAPDIADFLKVRYQTKSFLMRQKMILK